MNRSASTWAAGLVCLVALAAGAPVHGGAPGGCCLGDGTCIDGVTVAGCAAQDGVFAGDGTTCPTLVCSTTPYVFTLSPGGTSAAVPKFDDQGGTRNLTKVTLHLLVELRAALSLTNISTGQFIFDTSVTYDADVTATFGPVGPLVLMVDEVFDCGPGVILAPFETCDFGGPLLYTAEGMVMSPPPGDLGAFVGAGTIDADIEATGIFAFQGGVPFTLAVPIHFVSGRVTAIYEFLDKPGACCAIDGTCTDVSLDACTAAGSDWQGPNTVCDTANCPNTDDCNGNGIPDDVETLPEPAATAVDPLAPIGSTPPSGATDSCAQALHVCPGLTYQDTTANATNDGGSSECDGQIPYYDVWFRYRPKWDGPAAFSFYGTPMPMAVEIWNGCPGAGGVPIACAATPQTDAKVEVDAKADYWIRLGGSNGTTGPFRFTVNGPDCSLNAIDCNDNGIPDECECNADVTEDGTVDIDDLRQVIGAIGEPCNGCPEDLNGDGVVDRLDVLIVIIQFGDCPEEPTDGPPPPLTNGASLPAAP